MIPCHVAAKISNVEATRFGSMLYSSAISFAIGPAITIATVLFAVAQSTNDARQAIPSSPPRFVLICFLMV